MKHKYFFLGIVSTLIIFVIIFIVNMYLNINRVIYVKEVPKYKEKYETIENNIKKIEDKECALSLSTLLDRVDTTYYKKNIKIKDYKENYYIDGIPFHEAFASTLVVCDIKEDKIPSTINDVLASRVYPDSVINRYKTSYEFKISDYFNYKEIYEVSDNVGTYSNKILELKSLNELVKEVLDEESI